MKKLFCCFFVLMPLLLIAQDWKQLGVDDLFALARQKAFDKQRDESREMLSYILASHPDYHEVRIFLGRTYSWDNNYEAARQTLNDVLKKSPGETDAYRALADVEIWSEHPDDAFRIIIEGLRYFPNDDELLFKKAKVLASLNRLEEASSSLQVLMDRNPAYPGTSDLFETIKTGSLKHTAGVNYSVDVFNRSFDPAHFSSLQIARINRWGTGILRINYASRFDDTGVQPEIDLYPKIAKGVYMYLNYGISSSDLFPNHRVGGEIYTSLPKSFEASVGVRYLYFDSDTKVTIYTGSIGWYFGNYWVSLRPFVTPDERVGTSLSGNLLLRRYFNDAETYITLSAGLGFSPDIRRIQTSAGLSDDQVFLLQSQRIGIALQKTLKRNFSLQAGVDLSRQELLFDLDQYVTITSLTIGARKKF